MRGYLPLIQKDSSTNMHGLTVYVKGGLTSFCMGLISRKLCRFLLMFLFGFTLLRSTHLLLLLSLETLMSIIRTGLSILVELIDLLNFVIIFVSQMTLLRWLTFLLRSQTVILTVFLCRISFFLLTLVFVVQWLLLHWEIQIQGYIQAILMSGRPHKKLNLVIEFSNSTFIKFYFKACWCLKICIRNKCAYKAFFLF